MNHNYNYHDLQTALAYDRCELKSKTFEPEDRWAINTERSLLLKSNRNEPRKSFLCKSVLQRIKKILQDVERFKWEVPEYPF